MSIQENIKLDEQSMAAWNAHSVDDLLALLSNNIVWQDVGNPEPLRGKEAVRPYVQGWFTAFPDLYAVLKNRVVTEDQVATEIEFTGTNTGPLQMGPGAPPIPATGKKVTGKGTYFMRIRDGKVVEFHSYPDSAGLMMQLGLMPSAG
ncbi:MAG: ester cyclase [Chloroflexota bacterium]